MNIEDKSPKEQHVEEQIYDLLTHMVEHYTDGDNLPLRIWDLLKRNEEINAIQTYANTVSITRLGFNDHGPVHMKTACRNALKMLSLLHERAIQTSLEQEHAGSFTDSVCAVMMAAYMHDAGMTLGRKDHELYSMILTYPIIDAILKQVLPDNEQTLRRIVIRSLALECIVGHMGTHPIHSIEAGILLIADGCDMTKGRARIPLEIASKPAEGDIHKYSANAIEKVQISQGHDRPLKIEVEMKSEVGLFQVEEVLLPKIQSSPARHLVEVYAKVGDQDVKRYL